MTHTNKCTRDDGKIARCIRDRTERKMRIERLQQQMSIPLIGSDRLRPDDCYCVFLGTTLASVDRILNTLFARM